MFPEELLVADGQIATLVSAKNKIAGSKNNVSYALLTATLVCSGHSSTQQHRYNCRLRFAIS